MERRGQHNRKVGKNTNNKEWRRDSQISRSMRDRPRMTKVRQARKICRIEEEFVSKINYQNYTISTFKTNGISEKS
jgi:beta-lactamase class D